MYALRFHVHLTLRIQFGPLYSDNEDIARNIFKKLCHGISGDKIVIDTWYILSCTVYRDFFIRSALYGIYTRVNLFKKRTRFQINKCEVCIKRPYKTRPINKFVHFIDTYNYFLFERLPLSNLNWADLSVK